MGLVPSQIHNHYEIEPHVKRSRSNDKLSERVKRRRFVALKSVCCLEETVAKMVIDPLA